MNETNNFSSCGGFRHRANEWNGIGDSVFLSQYVIFPAHEQLDQWSRVSFASSHPSAKQAVPNITQRFDKLTVTQLLRKLICYEHRRCNTLFTGVSYGILIMSDESSQHSQTIYSRTIFKNPSLFATWAISSDDCLFSCNNLCVLISSQPYAFLPHRICAYLK